MQPRKFDFRKISAEMGKCQKSREENFRKTSAEVGKGLKAADRHLAKSVPFYGEMMQAAVDSLPFRRADVLRVIDFGCGTGNLAENIMRAYPRARLTCVDISLDMLRMATVKLFPFRKTFFCLGDLREFPYQGGYDLIVSSLTLKELSGDEKPAVYRSMFKALSRGGMFYNIDRIRSLSGEMKIMRKAGMKAQEVIWRGHGYAVCRAVKSR